MIIYAYYGLGKSTLTKAYPDKFIDIDEEYIVPQFAFDTPAVTNYINEQSKDKIALINGCLFLSENINVDIAFIPENFDMVEERLYKRDDVNYWFMQTVTEQFDDIIKAIKTKCKNVITLSEDEYLSQYADVLLRNYK